MHIYICMYIYVHHICMYVYALDAIHTQTYLWMYLHSKKAMLSVNLYQTILAFCFQYVFSLLTKEVQVTEL